jgi:hypothetical protein
MATAMMNENNRVNIEPRPSHRGCPACALASVEHFVQQAFPCAFSCSLSAVPVRPLPFASLLLPFRFVLSDTREPQRLCLSHSLAKRTCHSFAQVVPGVSRFIIYFQMFLRRNLLQSLPNARPALRDPCPRILERMLKNQALCESCRFCRVARAVFVRRRWGWRKILSLHNLFDESSARWRIPCWLSPSAGGPYVRGSSVSNVLSLAVGPCNCHPPDDSLLHLLHHPLLCASLPPG